MACRSPRHMSSACSFPTPSLEAIASSFSDHDLTKCSRGRNEHPLLMTVLSTGGTSGLDEFDVSRVPCSWGITARRSDECFRSGELWDLSGVQI